MHFLQVFNLVYMFLVSKPPKPQLGMSASLDAKVNEIGCSTPQIAAEKR